MEDRADRPQPVCVNTVLYRYRLSSPVLSVMLFQPISISGKHWLRHMQRGRNIMCNPKQCHPMCTPACTCIHTYIRPSYICMVHVGDSTQRVSTTRTSAPGCMYDNRNLKTLPASDIRNSKRQDRKPPYPRYSARRTALLGAEPRSAVYHFKYTNYRAYQ